MSILLIRGGARLNVQVDGGRAIFWRQAIAAPNLNDNLSVRACMHDVIHKSIGVFTGEGRIEGIRWRKTHLKHRISMLWEMRKVDIASDKGLGKSKTHAMDLYYSIHPVPPLLLSTPI